MTAFHIRANKVFATWFTDNTVYCTLAYGQSRADNRSEGTGIVYTTTKYSRNNTRVFMMDNDRAPGHQFEADFAPTEGSSLVPFFDGRNNTSSGTPTSKSPLGQSLGSSLVLLDALEEADGEDQRRRMYMATGEGGRLLSELQKGAIAFVGSGGTFVIYDRIFKMLTRAQTFSTALELGFVVEAIYFLQGEADASNGVMTSKEVYKSLRTQLFSDLRADIVTQTGQTTPVEIITDIVAGTPTGTSGAGVGSDVLIAQVEMAVENADGHTWCVGPNYQLPFFSSEHMSTDGVTLLGEMFARARYKVRLGQTPSFLYATDYSLVGNTITITCNVPTTPLVIDTTNLPNATGTSATGHVLYKGFEVTDGSGVTITNVSVNDTQIVLTLSGIPTGTVRVRYAMNGLGNTTYTDTATGRTDIHTPGSWGNIRDSQAIASYFVPNAYLRNFLAPLDHTF